MKKVLAILLLGMVLSCNQGKKELKVKEQTTEKQIDSLGIYNDVLNDLIENHLYHSYLGRDAQHLLVDYLVSEKIDSITFSKKINSLKNKIIFNDSLKGTLYLDEIYSGYERDIKFLDFPEEFKLEDVSLQIRKNNYIPIKAFKTEFVKLKKTSNKRVDTLKAFEVGELSLSKFLLNKDKSKGILYFAFICGGSCGEGSIILIKKTNNKWYVEKKQTLWEI
tara:strand:- start:29380 stop:30042 length:663 start_codon:yes stop_codon:yes gene_type:complete